MPSAYRCYSWGIETNTIWQSLLFTCLIVLIAGLRNGYSFILYLWKGSFLPSRNMALSAFPCWLRYTTWCTSSVLTTMNSHSRCWGKIYCCTCFTYNCTDFYNNLSCCFIHLYLYILVHCGGYCFCCAIVPHLEPKFFLNECAGKLHFSKSGFGPGGGLQGNNASLENWKTQSFTNRCL